MTSYMESKVIVNSVDPRRSTFVPEVEITAK
jgi:hypothetical protein